MIPEIADRAIEAEQAIIGSALVRGAEWAPSTALEPKDFFQRRHRVVWQAILELVADGIEVDLVTVFSRLNISAPEERQYIIGMAKSCPSSDTVSQYVELLRGYIRKARAAKVLMTAEKELQAARRGDECDKAVDKIISDLMGLSRHTARYEHTPRQYLTKAVEELEARKNGAIKAVQTGIESFDYATGGMHDSDLIILAGRPAMGKTAVAINMAMKSGVPVGFISGEQPADQIANRMISIAGMVSAEKLRSPKMMREDDWGRVFNGATKVSEGQVYINDTPQPTLSEIQRQGRKWAQEHGIKALFVDYIQRVQHGSDRMPKNEKIGEIARGLKSLARELNIPVVALAQVNREVEKRPDKRPGMADLYYSAEIEMEADMVVTLYRDEVYNEHSDSAGVLEMNVCKNRHGGTGVVRARWRGEYMQVLDIERRYDGGQ